MPSPHRAPVFDLDGVRWNGGSWFGSQIGGTAWMLTAFAAYSWQAPWIGLLFLAAFAGINALGFWIWRHRGRLRFSRALQWMTLLSAGVLLLALVAFGAFPAGSLVHDLAWQDGRPRWVGAGRSERRSAYLLLFVMFPALLIMFEVQGRQARRRNQSSR